MPDRWSGADADHAFRIGQKCNILTNQFICRGTTEERIDMLIESKLELAKQLLGRGGEINLTELGEGHSVEPVAMATEFLVVLSDPART